MSTRKVFIIRPGSLGKSADEATRCQQYLQHEFGLMTEFDRSACQKLSTKEKAHSILTACLRDDIDILWAIRGGEGTADILPLLADNHQALSGAKPKTIIGFSDVTPLLIFFAQQFGWPTVHGPGCLQFVSEHINKLTVEAVKNLVLQNQFTQINLQPLNQHATVQRELSTSLLGGNLSLLIISIKDVWEFDLANKVLIVEDVNEKSHVVTRSLKYLQRIGKLNQCAAIIFGDFMGLVNNQAEQDAIDKVLGEFAEKITIPVLRTDKFGHGRFNLPLPFNRQLTLSLGRSPRLHDVVNKAEL